MPSNAPLPVVFVPGGVTPVQPSYAPLLEELGGAIAPSLKELEVYADDQPPADYSIELEVAGLLRFADVAGLGTFHLVGYSGGGAVSLAFAARHPDRLRSLGVFEPANAPGPWLPDDHPEVACRPAGLRAMMRALQNDRTDPEALTHCPFPVYLAYGLLTAEHMVRRVQYLAGLFPDVWIQAYAGIHHFGPPQRTQPARYAAALRQLWARAESESTGIGPTSDRGYAA